MLKAGIRLVFGIFWPVVGTFKTTCAQVQNTILWFTFTVFTFTTVVAFM